MEEGFLDSDGVHLHYLDWGGAGQPMVLLAGLGDTAHLYRGLAPKLASRHRVLALTRRGHGQSDRPDAGYDLVTFVDDVCRFQDALDLGPAILVGHSFGGLEITNLAIRYPRRVKALVYLDALFPRLDPEPDLSGDPTWSLVPSGGPTPDDLASRDAYLAHARLARPAWARLWCEAIEANLMARVTFEQDGQLEYHHDDELMNSIYGMAFSTWQPAYDQVEAPMLAIVPDGDYHQAVPLDATEAQRRAADRYWRAKILPWLRERTSVFLESAPTARIVALDSPYHHIHIAQEDATAEAIDSFLAA